MTEHLIETIITFFSINKFVKLIIIDSLLNNLFIKEIVKEKP